MILFPNCKINLGLRVLRKRPDGYHDISTVMVPVAWTDVLEIVPASGFETTLTVTGNGVACSPHDNLVMKAYRKVAEAVPGLPPVDIYLRKIIPDGAGLGGGSSDASFTVIGLNSIFQLDLSYSQMAEITSAIGADCPFFIYNHVMSASGTGTEFAPCHVDLSDRWIVIVKPDESVSTREAYSGVRPDDSGLMPFEIVNRSVAEWSGLLVNDFERSVFMSCPAVADVKRRMVEAGAAYASMSGSGSAVYGLFDDEAAARRASGLFAGMKSFVSKMN